MHGRVGRAAGILVAAVAALALAVAPAGATTGHNSAGTFGIQFSDDPGGFSGGGPAGVAVDQTSGNVYATDPQHAGGSAPRVEQFDAVGTFGTEFPIDTNAYNTPQGIALDPNGAGALWVGVNDVNGQGTVVEYSLAGVPTGDVTTAPAGITLNPSAVAVDPTTGNVFVAGNDNNNGGVPIVAIFDDAGAFQSSFDGSDSAAADGPFQNIVSIAVDGSSRVYVSDSGKNRLERYSAAGAYQATVTATGGFVGVGPVAADPSTDEIYLGENNNRVEVFTAGGADHQDVFGLGAATMAGLAVNSGSGTVYAADRDQSFVLIASPFPGSTVETTPLDPTTVDATSATLTGNVDPENIDTNYAFEYSSGPDFENRSAGGPVGNDNTSHPVSDQVQGLLPNTKYYYRVLGDNADFTGAVRGATETFTTAPAPPIVENAPSFASAIRPDGATLNGTIDPRGSDTNWHFEYGTTTAYGSTISGQPSPIIGQYDQAATSDPIAGLTPGTTYHFRLVANNGTGGDVVGPDHTFVTAPAAAAGATSVTGITAVLSGTVNPQGHATTYHFEYGESAGTYGSTTPERNAGSANAETTVSTSIDKLKPGTLYHVRVVATDTTNGVVTTGVDGTFTTNPAPSAATGAVSGVTTDSATFSGVADTHGLGGTYTFYVSSANSPYTGKTAPVTIPAGAAAGTVTATLTGLPPGQTYTVRLGVDSSLVTTVGDTVTFATAPLPLVNPPAPPPTVENPYGCAHPVLNAYNSHPKPGDRISVTGSDLGVFGTVALGDDTITPDTWGATSFTFLVPDDAKGTLPLTINCGKASNTVAVQMYQPPSNALSTPKGKVKGSTASVTLKVPGPGDITVSGAGLKTAKKHVGKAGTYTVKATLSASGKTSLKRHKKLSRTLKVSFRPNGGTAASKSVKVTFKR